MSLHVTRFEDGASFLARAGVFLLEREALHNLLYGIATESDGRDGSYLATVEHEGSVVLAAVRIPPHNLLLSQAGHPGALEALARDLRNGGHTPPGVHGPRQEAADFVELWTGIGGCSARARMAQRVHQASAVTPPAGVAGAAREAGGDDLELLRRWSAAFVAEALPGEPHDDLAWASRRVGKQERGVLLWEVDGAPVAMAGFAGRTPNGIRIGGVYTLPEQRGRRYASACVAALSERLLASGHRFVFLFTDLANPHAHRLYERLGYRPMGNVNVHTFTYASYQEGERAMRR